jgi:hypothetical protein
LRRTALVASWQTCFISSPWALRAASWTRPLGAQKPRLPKVSYANLSFSHLALPTSILIQDIAVIFVIFLITGPVAFGLVIFCFCIAIEFGVTTLLPNANACDDFTAAFRRH